MFFVKGMPMTLAMNQIKVAANTHMRRDIALVRKWICECESCREMRSLVGMEKMFDVRPLVREILQIEEQLRDLSDGPEMHTLLEQYVAAYDKLAEAMAK
jgi:hypothetical protein